MSEKSKNAIRISTHFENLTHGDLKKIQKMSGRCYDTVRKTLVYGTRKNKEVLNAAKEISALNKKLKIF